MANDKTPKKWQLFAQKITGHRGLKKAYSLDELQKEFIAFVDYYSNNPSTYYQRTKQRQKGADKTKAEFEFAGDRVDRVAPMTEYAFCLWIGKSKSWFPQTITNLKNIKNPNEEDEEYLEFMLELKTFFSSQLLEGAILGEYSQPLVASLLGMRNNVDVTSDGKAAMPIISIVEDKKSRDDYDASKQ